MSHILHALCNVFQAIVMWEPASHDLLRNVELNNPNLIMGTKLSERCLDIFQNNHVTYFEYWTCPKILMEAKVRTKVNIGIALRGLVK